MARRSSSRPASLPGASRDLVLLLGIEPNLSGAAFCDDVVAVARTTGCELVVTIGALLGDTPHSRPIQCTGSATDEVLAAAPGHAAVALRRPDRNRRRAARRGPPRRLRVGIDLGTGAALRRDAAQPQGDTRAPRQACAGCSTCSLDLTDLDIASSAWERSVAEVVAGDTRCSGYVARLEARYDSAADEPWIGDDDEEDEDDDDWLDEDDLPSGESLAEDFERYLRDQDDE